ncbi:MAG TPA: hypothetical protein DD735_01160 [Clostridiales bacterium]|jgi:hypothetical protein|nr:hypothetical protein [Clostridiales bacterium]
MKAIPLEIWQPAPDNPRMLTRTGQRTAQEVFAELKQRLDSLGYLPDEYFELGMEWENGKEIPAGADIFVTTDYGSSEGIYLDVYLKWYEDNKPVTKSFITGKTLGDTGADMDRMFLISSAITKAFHGDHGSYARYVKLGDTPEDTGIVVHLNPAEQRLLIDALIAQRESLLAQTTGTEQLLRRMTGSITEFVNEVGQRPLRIGDFDAAVLAVQDGNLEAFKAAYPKALEQVDALLVETASRPDAVGRKMLMTLFVDAPPFSNEAYLAACKRAVDTGESERVLFLAEQAEGHVHELDMSLYGEAICHAYQNHRHIAESLIRQCTPEQIAAADPRLLHLVATQGDYNTAIALAEKGFNADPVAGRVIQVFHNNNNDWITERMLERGMQISNDNYGALHACIATGNQAAAQLLLDRGMDFQHYLDGLAKLGESPDYYETLEAVTEYWNNIIGQTQGRMEMM